MKELVSIVCIVAITASAWGVSLTACFDGSSGTEVTVGYAANGSTSATRARAFALTLTAGSGAKFLKVTPTKTGQSVTGSPGYGIFPGTIVINSNTGAVKNYGTPVEPNYLNGMGQSALGSGQIIVVLCSRYEGNAHAPAANGNLLTVTMDKHCTVTVTPETEHRDGVVSEDGDTMRVDPITLLENADRSRCQKSVKAMPDPTPNDTHVPLVFFDPAQCAVTNNWLSKSTIADYNGDSICGPKDWALACRDDFLAKGIIWGRDEESLARNLGIYIDEVYNREQHKLSNSRAHHDLARMRADWITAYVDIVWMAAIGKQWPNVR